MVGSQPGLLSSSDASRSGARSNFARARYAMPRLCMVVSVSG